jgi:hypothetical protein
LREKQSQLRATRAVIQSLVLRDSIWRRVAAQRRRRKRAKSPRGGVVLRTYALCTLSTPSRAFLCNVDNTRAVLAGIRIHRLTNIQRKIRHLT